MGAGQSSAGGGDSGGGGDIKTSYYELLGVERTATSDELKKAYRRKALELHPDRNHGDTERTTALFADIQVAYEVLSDDQERAWYDAHEYDILRGGSGEGETEDSYQGNMRVTTSDDLARMMGKFRGNVDFSDSPNGFYGFVRETFEQLAQEEEYAADYDNVDIPSYPSFGHKNDNHNDVVRDFYAAWNGFATAKSYAWKDKYRLADAPDRRTRRLMEKENLKFREDGRREFNEAVRTLVAFVRKRDPRYTPDTQSADEKAKAQRDARKAQAAKARAAQLAKLEEEAQALPDWATARPADEEEEETEEESEEEQFECVACNKTFKSERQYEAHERSKKHQKAIQALKRKMKKDNAHLHLDEDVVSSDVITPADDDAMSEVDASDSVQDVTEKAAELDLNGKQDGSEKEVEVDLEASQDDSDEADAPKVTQPTEPDTKADEENSADTDTDSSSNDEYTSRSAVESRLGTLTNDTPPSTNPPTTDSTTPAPSDPSPTPAAPKLGAAALKRAKRAAKASSSNAGDSATAGQKCLGCDATFTSKTQLFAHLQEHPRHAALKSVADGPGGKKGKKGKR